MLVNRSALASPDHFANKNQPLRGGCDPRRTAAASLKQVKAMDGAKRTFVIRGAQPRPHRSGITAGYRLASSG